MPSSSSTTKKYKKTAKKRKTSKRSESAVIQVPMKPIEEIDPVPVPSSQPPISPQIPPETNPLPTTELTTPQIPPEIPQPKTKKPSSKIQLEKSELVKMFLEMLTTIKLYHWNTHSYARHKATDDLYEKLSDLVDEFVEVMQGKMFSPNRIHIINSEIKALTPETKEKMVDKILYYNEQLQNLSNVFSSKKDSDLLNIRDEMMAHLNQFLYLFSFDEI